MLAQQPATPSLDPVEWNTVAIALQDAARRVAQPSDPQSLRGRLGQLYAKLTGNMPVRPLADPRLEALRRFVDQTRRSRRVAMDLVPNLIAQGFSRAQVDAIALLSA